MTLQDEIIKELGVKPVIDPKEEIRVSVDFLKDYLKKYPFIKSFVLGISGGQDSSLAGRLAQIAIEEMRQAFEERLNTIYPLLNEVPGFEAIKPQGAFYLFPNVKKAMKMKGYTDVTEFTTAILEEAEVALVTGAGFGAPENIRLSYATDLDTLKEAVRRLKAFMEK